jgi:hypothetical protein
MNENGKKIIKKIITNWMIQSNIVYKTDNNCVYTSQADLAFIIQQHLSISRIYLGIYHLYVFSLFSSLSSSLLVQCIHIISGIYFISFVEKSKHGIVILPPDNVSDCGLDFSCFSVDNKRIFIYVYKS